MAVPLAETAFPHARIIDGLDSTQYVGESLRGGMCAPQIGTDDEPMAHFRPTVHIQAFQSLGGLPDLPFAHGVQRDVDLSLKFVGGVVRSASVTDEEYGTDVIAHRNGSFVSGCARSRSMAGQSRQSRSSP